MLRWLWVLLLWLPLAAGAEGADWAARYQRALERARHGQLEQARAQFLALAAEASSSTQQARASAAAELLGALVAARAEGRAVAPGRVERSGGELARLYIDGIWYGVGTGAMIWSHTEASSAAGTVLPMLGLAGAGAAAIALVDRQDGWAYGQPRAISAGLRIGLLEGLAFTAWYQAQARWQDELSFSGATTLVWGLTTAGAVAGAVIGAVTDVTPGQAAFVESGGLWSGALAGLVMGALMPSSDQADDAFLLTTAIALNLGAAGAAWLAAQEAPSPDRALFLDLGGIAGTLAAGGLYLAVADGDGGPRGLMASTAVGLAAGLGLAWWLTAHLPPDTPRAAREPREPRAQLQVLPLEGGGLVGMAGQF